MTMTPEVVANWLNFFNLLWAIFGFVVLWGVHKLRQVLVRSYKNYNKMTEVILGNAERGMPGIAERLNLMEQSDAINREHRENNNKVMTDLRTLTEGMTSLREEVALNTGSTEHLNRRVTAQEDLLSSIKKELTHNGGGSVKDMARDAAENSRTTLTLMRARDDMDTITAYFIADAEGEYSWVSETLLTWTRFHQPDLLGFGWMNAVYLEDRAAVREEWDSAVADDRDFILSFRMWTKTREPFWVRAAAKKVTGTTGATVKGWYGSIKRMTAEEIAQHLADNE